MGQHVNQPVASPLVSEASGARLVIAADAERRGFERTLHDGVQQELVALVVNLELARRLCATDPAAAVELLEELGRDARAALDGVRTLASEIYPPLLDAGGLLVAVRAAAAAEGMVAHVEVEALPTARPELAVTVFFCCREALRNAARHAGPGARAKVSVRVEGASVVVEIADDGCGFATPAPPDGGLCRLQDRVSALGGSLEIDSEPGHGTSVRGRLPLTARQPLSDR